MFSGYQSLWYFDQHLTYINGFLFHGTAVLLLWMRRSYHVEEIGLMKQEMYTSVTIFFFLFVTLFNLPLC